MFRSARWRNDKNKIKTVFKLQFHASQVTELNNVDTMAICVVPGDTGKRTARLANGVIRQGICRWEHPVYETVKFFQDSKTGKIHQRIYHFIVSTLIVSTGLLKSNFVGEASIDLASYVESTNVSIVSLPLKNSKSNVVLHVSIQRLQGNFCQRDVEESENKSLKAQNRTLHTLLNYGNEEECTKSNSDEDRLPNDAIAKLNGCYRTSSGSDITMSSSESSSGLDTPRELGLGNENILQEPTNFASSRSHKLASHKPTAYVSATACDEHSQSEWEFLEPSDHGISTDGTLHSSQYILTGKTSEGSSDIEVGKLRAEIVALARQVDISELELQSLRKQIIKESKRGQDLSREVTGLKGERDALRAEREKLRRTDGAKSINKSHFEDGNLQILDKIKEELHHEKDLNANLQMQLQKTQEANAELMLAVKDLEETLEQKNKEIFNPSNRSRLSDNATFRSESDDEDQTALEELVKEQKDAKQTFLLEQKIMDLSSEIEIYRRDKDELEMQMEQLALDYEILKQENHNMLYKLQQSELQEQLTMQYECSSSSANITELEVQIESLENQLMKQSKEHSDSLKMINRLETRIQSLETELKKQNKEQSDSLETINKLEAQIKSLEDELEMQSQGFESDLEAVTHAKVEQEQRAIRAEDALRMTRQKNANTAEKMQEELKRLSMQMAPALDANKKAAMKAVAEANQLHMQKSQLEQMLQKANEELKLVRDEYEAKVHGLSDKLDLQVNRMEQMFAEINDKSRQLEHQKKNEEELVGSFSEEILGLKGEIEKLRLENNILYEKAEEKESLKVELEQLKLAMKYTEELSHKSNMERNELASTIARLKKEADKSTEELNRMKSLLHEKEKAGSVLKTEVKTLKAECDDLRHSLLEKELEKEKLRKRVVQLNGNLKNKEDTIINSEKKLEETEKHAAVSDITKLELPDDTVGNTSDCGLSEDTRNEHHNRTAWMSKENGNANSFVKSCAIISEKEMETQITLNVDELSSELESLKERNKLMENELKEMQERYSEISLKFAEVEGERQQLVMRMRSLKNAKKW